MDRKEIEMRTHERMVNGAHVSIREVVRQNLEEARVRHIVQQDARGARIITTTASDTAAMGDGAC